MAQETILTIPLRKEFSKAVYFKRASRAISATRSLVARHSKTDESNIRIGPYLNQEILSRGRRNPPAKIKVRVWKDADFTRVELASAPQETPAAKEKETKSPKIKLPLKEVQKEEKIKAEEQEKKEILTSQPTPVHEKQHEIVKHFEKSELTKKEMTEKIFPKSQKPTHEKKK